MQKNILLVSASPRRKELLSAMGVKFKVNTHTHFIENMPSGISPEEVPALFAEGKSTEFHRDLDKDEVLISADTVVICDGKILGKPYHRQTAKDMLHFLSGKTHKVVSAVCVRDAKSTKTLSDTAYVTVRKLSNEEIDSYVEKYLPTDKAGAYGIQEWFGMTAVTSIQGSYYTIMGLPTHLTYQLLKEFKAL